MKNISFLLIALFSSLSAFGQNDAIQTLFSEYMDQDDFNSVYVSPRMFQMISNVDIEDMEQDTKDILENIKGLRILSTDNNGIELFKKSKRLLNTNSYDVLMTVKDEDQDIEFLIKDSDNGNIVQELLLLVGGKDGFTMMSFVGNLDLKKLSKLAKDMDISGLEHLEKLDKK